MSKLLLRVGCEAGIPAPLSGASCFSDVEDSAMVACDDAESVGRSTTTRLCGPALTEEALLFEKREGGGWPLVFLLSSMSDSDSEAEVSKGDGSEDVGIK